MTGSLHVVKWTMCYGDANRSVRHLGELAVRRQGERMDLSLIFLAVVKRTSGESAVPVSRRGFRACRRRSIRIAAARPQNVSSFNLKVTM